MDEVTNPAALSQARAIVNDPSHPFHKGNESARAEVVGLYRAACQPAATPEAAVSAAEAAPPPVAGEQHGFRPKGSNAAEARVKEILSDRKFMKGTHERQADLETEYAQLQHHLHPDQGELEAEYPHLMRILNPETPGPGKPTPPVEQPPGQPGEVLPPPPDPGLTQVWHDPETREVVTSLGEIAMPAGEVTGWIDYAKSTDPATIPQPEETEATLRQEWGGDFDAKLAAARLAVGRMPRAFAAFLNRTALGDDPKVIRRLAELGAPLREAREEIDRTLRDRRHPFQDTRHPQHEVAVSRIHGLYQRVYGTR
jgi:hypothetical protein